MFNNEIKKLKTKQKDVLHNIEILDKKMKRGRISSTEYFTEFDNQKLLLKQIKEKIQELEELKKQKPHKTKEIGEDLTPKDEIFSSTQIVNNNLNKRNIESDNTEEETDNSSLKEKIKSYLPNLPDLKLKIETAFSKTEPELNIKKDNLRNFKFFHENRMDLNEHPNFIHLAVRDYLEELGYKILKIKKPLPELVEIEQGKSKIIETSGYLVGVKMLDSEDIEETLSIFVRQEGVCTIYFNGQGVVTTMRAQISLAGNSDPEYDDVLKSDLDKLDEKIKLIQ